MARRKRKKRANIWKMIVIICAIIFVYIAQAKESITDAKIEIPAPLVDRPEQILIVGNGGIKQTRKYQDDSLLNGYVITFQNFEKLIHDGIKSGRITIQEKELVGIEDKTFDL